MQYVFFLPSLGILGYTARIPAATNSVIVTLTNPPRSLRLSVVALGLLAIQRIFILLSA